LKDEGITHKMTCWRYLFVLIPTIILGQVSKSTESGFSPSLYPCAYKPNLGEDVQIPEGIRFTIDGNPPAYQPHSMYHGEFRWCMYKRVSDKTQTINKSKKHTMTLFQFTD